ncbi:MAG: hypothetical protein P4L67_05215 [Candidatus Pacebacteria bacterium]|nr:hypothetical protein [Candidatus Paceibacterota bacterium]
MAKAMDITGQVFGRLTAVSRLVGPNISTVSMDHAVEVAQAARLKFIRDNEGRLSYDPDWHLKNRFAEE